MHTLDTAPQRPLVASRQSHGHRQGVTRAYDPRAPVSTSSPYSPYNSSTYNSGAYGLDSYAPPPPVLGTRVEKWLKTPFDIAAFGPRAATGALLVLPERLSTLQSDFQKYMDLMQDPRPMDEKQDVLLREAEDYLITALSRGAVVETDVLATLKTVLPPQAADFINEFVPRPPSPEASWPPAAAAPFNPAGAPIYAAPPAAYPQGDVISMRLAAESAEIKGAVSGLRTALESVRVNNEFSKTKLLRQNLKDSRDLLARRLQEVSPASTADPGINAAAREARILLDEVDAQFFL